MRYRRTDIDGAGVIMSTDFETPALVEFRDFRDDADVGYKAGEHLVILSRTGFAQNGIGGLGHLIAGL